MAVVKHLALNLLQQTKPISSPKNRRKLATRNLAYLAKRLGGTA